MRKFAMAFLRNPNPSLYSLSFFKRDPPLSTLAPGESGIPDAGEVGDWKRTALPADIAMAASRKARKLKSGSLHAETSTAKAKAKARPKALHSEIATAMAAEEAKARPKASGKAKRKTKANVELGHIVAGAKECELLEIGAFKAEDVEEETAAQNVATEKAEEIASHAKAKSTVVDEEISVIQRAEQVALLAESNESMTNARQELSECLAKLDLNSYTYGQRWEETAYKLLDYGISAAHVMRMLPKCKNMYCRRSPDSTLKQFTMLGMSHEQIGRVISLRPNILRISDNMFQSKVEFFHSVGLDGHSLGKVMHMVAVGMSNSLSSLRGRCDFWKEYLQDVQVDAWRTFILKYPKVLTLGLEQTVKPKLVYLEKQGCSKKILLTCPSILFLSLEVIAIKIKLMEQFGMSSPRNCIRLVAALHRFGTPKLHERLHNLIVLGFSLNQVQKMMVNQPKLLAFIEDRTNLRVSYAVFVMNLSLDTLAGCSPFWSCSFEKRIKFRHEVIQELISLGAHTKNISLQYMVSMTDTCFSRKFVERLEA